ncbi:MAG: metallophosphoesterase family protein [Chloroflexi bacterium]|nr:metallophosphoesterase family protein [Chloroflexota bacterium]
MTTVLLLSDIHGNLSALEKTLEDASQRADITSVWVMGDSVGYGAQPNEVIERLRSLPDLAMVKGNHEAAAIGEISIANFNPSAAASAAWTADALTTETRDFLTSLPLTTVQASITLCHGTPRNPIWEYMFTSQTADLNLNHFDTVGCVHGHTHIPSVFGGDASANWQVIQARDADVFQLDYERWFVNPGSVGQPRDGDPRASYALLQLTDNIAPRIQFHRVEYDVAKAQGLILDAHLPSTLAFRLSVGR